MYTALASIYIITSILIIKSDVMKKQLELNRIIEEQERVRQELKRKEEEEKEQAEQERRKREREKREKKEKEKKKEKRRELNLRGIMREHCNLSIYQLGLVAYIFFIYVFVPQLRNSIYKKKKCIRYYTI